MRIAVIGPPADLHLRRWGEALREAGAEVLFIGIERAPPDLQPYLSVGDPVEIPRWIDFFARRHRLREILLQEKVDLAHPIHLTPSGVWVWSSGFRPYVPFAMGADVLEYSPYPPPIERTWALQNSSPTLLRKILIHLRRRLLPPFLAATLRHSLFAMGDNYDICFTKKFFVKNKKYIELPTGIRLGNGQQAERRLILAPRGATLLYQADIILEGYEAYLRSGGSLPLYLLAGAYPPHPAIYQKAQRLKNDFPDLFFFFQKSISKKEIERLWSQTLAFISAPVYDGYSYAVAEGRGWGALPIVNAIPAHLEILTHGYNALFVEPFTPDKLAETLHRVEQLRQEAPFWQAPNTLWIRRFSDLVENVKLFLNLVESALANVEK